MDTWQREQSLQSGSSLGELWALVSIPGYNLSELLRDRFVGLARAVSLWPSELPFSRSYISFLLVCEIKKDLFWFRVWKYSPLYWEKHVDGHVEQLVTLNLQAESREQWRLVLSLLFVFCSYWGPSSWDGAAYTRGCSPQLNLSANNLTDTPRVVFPGWPQIQSSW